MKLEITGASNWVNRMFEACGKLYEAGLRGSGPLPAGDAHRLSEMHCGTMVKVRDLTIAELRLAFTGREGRRAIN